MVKDSVLITSDANLGFSQDAPAGVSVITVTFAGNVIEPILVLGASLENGCRGFLVPYGADVTIKVSETNNFILTFFGIQYGSMQFSAGSISKFKAVRDVYFRNVSASTLQDEIAPT